MADLLFGGGIFAVQAAGVLFEFGVFAAAVGQLLLQFGQAAVEGGCGGQFGFCLF